jgi:hypothetical protein
MEKDPELIFDNLTDDVQARKEAYPDHFEEDVVIPGRITQRTTFITSHLLLISSIMGYVYGNLSD